MTLFRRYAWIITLIGCLCCQTNAQQVVPEQLLDLNNTDIVNQNKNVAYDGAPAMLIESNTPIQPAVQPPVSKIPDIPIRTPFGHMRTAAFLDQATDFVSLIHIMDRNTLRIEERIQIVNTHPGALFQRVLPQVITTPDNQERRIDIDVQTVNIDGTNITVRQQNIGTAVVLTGKQPLSTGVHNITVTYLVQGAIYQNQAVSDLYIGLTGPAWPLMTERFTTVVFFPHQTDCYQKELLFGSNNVRIPQNVTVTTDEQGNTVFQTTHPLPARADVRLHMIMDSKPLPVSDTDFWLKIPSATLATLICFGILLLYMFSSILSLRYQKHPKPLKEMLHIHPLLWQTAIGRRVTVSETEKIIAVTENLHQKAYLTRFIQKGLTCSPTQKITYIFLRVISFLRFNIEYIIGCAGLIFLTVFIAGRLNITIGKNYLIVLTGMACGVVFLMNRFGVRTQLNCFRQQVRDIFLTTLHGLNQSPKTVAIYYPYTVSLGFSKEWEERLLNHNPSYRDLSFFKEEHL